MDSRDYSEPAQAELDSHYGYVYKITNVKNNRVYFGQHKHKPGERWRQYLGSGSAKRFQKLAKEYKLKELVGYAEDRKELNRLELTTIMQARLAGQALYNRSSGGIVGTYSAIKAYFKCSDEELLLLLEANEHDWDQLAMIYRREREKKRQARRARQASVKLNDGLLNFTRSDAADNLE